MFVTILKLKLLSYRFKNNILVPASNLAEVNRSWLKWVSVKVWRLEIAVQNYLHVLRDYVVVWLTAGEGPLDKTVLCNSSYPPPHSPGWETVRRSHRCHHRHSFDTTGRFDSSSTKCELPRRGTSPDSSKDLGPVPLFSLSRQRRLGGISLSQALGCPRGLLTLLQLVVVSVCIRSLIVGAAMGVSDDISCSLGVLLSQWDWDEDILEAGVLRSGAFQEVIAFLPAENQLSPGPVTRRAHSTDSVSALRKLTVKNLYQGHLIHFYYFLLGNFTFTIFWLEREHGTFCLAKLVFHTIPPSEGETTASAWDTGRITKKANHLGEYR